MPSPTISHLICTTALIFLIFAVQVYYFHIVNSVWTEMSVRELKEITDYVADSLANLYFLANSTRSVVTLEKTLSLPSEIAGSSYTIEILYDGSKVAQSIKGHFNTKTWLNTASWLPPGLKVHSTFYKPIVSSDKTVVAGCSRESANVYVWIAYKT